jgi:hypothetical protein
MHNIDGNQGGYKRAVDPKKSVSHCNEGSSVYVHALLQLLGNIFQLITPRLTSTHLTPDLRTIQFYIYYWCFVLLSMFGIKINVSSVL